MSMRYLGGFITASYNPLKVPNPPTIVSATAGVGQVSVAFTAPSNVGGSAITSFTVLVTDSSSGATFTNSGATSPIVVTGLTAGATYTAKVLAVNSYGPSAFSAPSGSFSPLTPILFSWGEGSNGKLGQNSVTNLSSPVQVGTSTWTQLARSFRTSIAVNTNGSLWSWGFNGNGELGQNDRVSRSSPVQVGALTDWSRVAAGFSFCVAVKTNGTLWSWGSNSGQLGLNDQVARSSPVQVGALTDWAQVSAGGSFCTAIKTNGTLWSWGNGFFGELGLNASGVGSYRSSPVQVGALTDWAQTSNGNDFCIAIRTNGTLYSWGRNNYYQLGQNIVRASSLSNPTQIGSLTVWARVSTGSNFSTCVRTNGTLWTWGRGTAGALGNGETSDKNNPEQVGALTDWSQVSGASYFCTAIKTNGTLWSWGRGYVGQLARGNTTSFTSPVQVGSLTTWQTLSQGFIGSHVLATRI